MPYVDTSYNYGEAIQEICRMVGHPVPSDAAGSTDEAVQQMGTSLNRALAELLTMFEWQDLTVKSSISVVADSLGQTEKGFDLPDDFDRFVDQTQWAQSNSLPAAGPLSPQAWMTYLVRSTSPQLTLAWQLRGDQIWFLAPPFPDASTFEFMYISKAMVIDADDPNNTKNVASKNGDEFVIDDYLVLLLGKAKYLEAKGFDSSASLRDFLIAFNSRTGSNKAAPILNIGSPVRSEPLLNPNRNLPDTGYGA